MPEPVVPTAAERNLARELSELRREVDRIKRGNLATQLGHTSIEGIDELILGRRDGRHVRAGGFGLRQFSDTGLLTMALGAGSVVGGNFLTVVDPDTGLSLAAIDPMGVVTATDFQVSGDAVFGGDLLPDVIDGRLIGDLVAHFALTATSATTTGTLGLLELVFEATANSYYEITTSPVLVGSSAGDDVERCSVNLHYTLDGTAPSVTSPLLARDQGKDDRSFQISRLLYVANAATVRLLLSITDLGTGGVNVQPTTDRPLQLYVKRVGKVLVAQNGQTSDGGGNTSTPPQQKTKTYYSTWSRKWDKDSIEGDTTTPMVQGNFQDIHGDWHSVFGFNQYDQIRDDLAGSTIDKCELFLYANHWAAPNGGYARVRTTGLRVPPGNNLYPPVSPTRWVIQLPKPGGRWTDVGTLVGQEIRDGTVGAFALDARDVAYNPEDAGSFVPGRETAVDNRPALRVTYTK